MAALIAVGLLSLVVLVTSVDGKELLKNGDFQTDVGWSNWYCNGCVGCVVSWGDGGNKAYKATDRSAGWNGPWQDIEVTDFSRTYSLSGYVRILGTRSNTQIVTATLAISLKDGTTTYKELARVSATPTSGRVHLHGEDIAITGVQQNLVNKVQFYVSGPDAGVEFVVDGLSFSVTDNDKWSIDEARKSIEKIRKADLQVNIRAMTPFNNVVIRVEQISHEFGFGSAIDSQTLVSNANYRDWYLKHFEWAVMENDMKWRQTEFNRGQPNWKHADAALKILEQNKKRVRGHAIFWANKSRNPNWVQAITDGKELHSVCMKRVDDIVGRYKSRVAHWDVNNEMLHYSFFQSVYGSPQIRHDMLNRANAVDPQAKLFVNDFNVVSWSKTEEYVKQIRQLVDAGVPLHGIGVQGHFNTNHQPTGQEIRDRLDKLAATGLPIWVTELDYANADEQKRAEFLEEALTIFFSHPAVEGVLFWGFWESRHWRGQEAALVNGPDMQENASGRMWSRLYGTEWRTSLSSGAPVNLSSDGATAETFRVFHGKLRVTVTGDGILHQRHVDVPKSKNRTVINITL